MIDEDDDLLICPRCKNPVSILPDAAGEGTVYFCYECIREIEDPIEEDEGASDDFRYRPEFELAPTWQAWVFALSVALLLVLAVLLQS